MLDLSFAARVKVDDTYEDLLNSHAFRQYKNPAQSIEAAYDALILRLYENEGDLVDERLVDVPSYSDKAKAPAQVPRKEEYLQWQVTSAGNSSASNYYHAANVSVSWPDERGRNDPFTLVDQFRPVFFDEHDPTLFRRPLPHKPLYVALCLVYLPMPSPRDQRYTFDGTMDMKNYLLQQKYASSFVVQSGNNAFTSISGSTV